MLYISLVFSGVLLVVAFLAYRYAEYPTTTTIGTAAAVTVLPACVTFVFPAVWLQSAILCGGLLIALLFDRSRQSLRPLATVSVLIAYAYTGYDGLEERREYDRMRAEYPFESMEDRLPRAPAAAAPGDHAVLESLERKVEQEAYSGRSGALQLLHERTVSEFANSAGFGQARMSRTWQMTQSQLNPKTRDEAPQQPDYFQPDLQPADPHSRRPDRSSLGGLHEDSFLDFVNPRGFGFVKDRQHVAGFQSHGFSKVPKPVGGWNVAGLELVGLLQHEKPVVYVSAKLPRMDELKDAPTRPPDAFETAGLAALRGGADLHVGDGANGWRFVGAVRATKQCLGCHGGERGALLGAFSYRLRPGE